MIVFLEFSSAGLKEHWFVSSFSHFSLSRSSSTLLCARFYAVGENNTSIIWALTQENLSLRFVNNEGADQPAHPCRLISTSVIRFLESIISINLPPAKFQFSS